MMIRHSMHYDENKEQWLVDIQGKDYSLHCGESFELYIGRKSIPCRLELADKWYVIMGDVSFDLRINDRYKIKL